MKKSLKIIFTTIVFIIVYIALSYKVNYKELLLPDFIFILIFIIMYIITIFFLIRNNGNKDINIIKELGYIEPSYNEYKNIIDNKNFVDLFMITTDNRKFDHTEYITDSSSRILFKIKQNLFNNASYNIYDPFENKVGYIRKSNIFIVNQKITFKNVCKYNVSKKFNLNKTIFKINNSDYYIESLDDTMKGVIYKGEEKIGAIDELIDKNNKLKRHSYFKVYNNNYIYEVISLILGMYSIKRIFKDI